MGVFNLQSQSQILLRIGFSNPNLHLGKIKLQSRLIFRSSSPQDNEQRGGGTFCYYYSFLGDLSTYIVRESPLTSSCISNTISLRCHQPSHAFCRDRLRRSPSESSIHVSRHKCFTSCSFVQPLPAHLLSTGNLMRDIFTSSSAQALYIFDSFLRDIFGVYAGLYLEQRIP